MARGLLSAIVVLGAVMCASAVVLESSNPTANVRVEKENWNVAPERWARGARADPDAPLELIIAVKQTNGDELERVLLDVSDPDSPNYGNHLTADEVDRLVAPKSTDILAVLGWLHRNGVDMDEIEATGNSDFLTIPTTVAVAERLLQAEYYTFTHKIASKFNVLRIGDGSYTLPADVASAVDFVSPSVRFPSIRQLTVRRPANPDIGVTPSFLRKLYKVGDATGMASNNNQSVAQFLGQYYSPSDLQTFFKSFSPSEVGKTPSEFGPNDSSNPGMEASLDIQYIMSVGTNVPTTFWSTAGQQPFNPGNEPFLKFLTIIAKTSGNGMPKTLSVSYGDDEPGVNYGYAVRVNAEFKKAGARGISIMFASGDGGVSGSQPGECTKFIPTFPAASPWVTAVGGTQGYNPETAAQLSAGGFSDYWPRPAYQDDAVKHYFSVAQNLPAASHYNQTGAAFPDVSAQSENFNIVVGGFTTFVAGTSCASPTFTGVVSLLNDLRLQAGKSPLGYLNLLFYKNPSMFTDITSGNNPGCGTNGFQAAVGYDPITGLGTANYEKMKAVIATLR